ncbi:MAG: valine--tRNA ligase [Patescibacteria group bacterium]
MDMKDLPKAYDAAAVEADIFKQWEESGAFDPDKLAELDPRYKGAKPYCIVLPPPNRTGTLHLGHAKMLAIEDLLIRFHRMLGKKTYWVPGTDHAALATQVKVEQILVKEGIKNPRKDLGRERLLERIDQFVQKSRDTIVEQCKRMGSSMDWKREKYTLDAERNLAVNTVFKMMFEDGLIERGYRVVNWDPTFQTTLSDDEVDHKDTQAELVTFTYDKDFPIAISTTRPETKFGDTGVAVHPDDKRYKKFVGKTLTANFCGKQITLKVIADAEVDPKFGTGALGVTPAHSLIDADLAGRHDLPMVQVIGQDGKMTAEAGKDFEGLTTIEARKKIVEMLEKQGCVQKKETVPQSLLIAQRGESPVEQLPMRQWFVRVNKNFKLRNNTLSKWKKGDETTLKDLMSYAVESKQIKILPDNFEKIYFHWVNNLRDWCISRQIWFGHQIPVWYKGDETKVSNDQPSEGWTRDPDTLDTWFSSGLWTFSTLGWPDKEKWAKEREFHPTDVLETGYDILFFWVARMILMSTYVLGEIPFKDVYLHGLVRDEKGRKMSKSIGNVLDPLDLIPKYGTDAVRLSLVMGTSPGMDQKLSEDKIKDFRNFTNKLWNISRFILTTTKLEARNSKLEAKTLADRWILARLSEVQTNATKLISEYQFSQAGDILREFTWSDFADWYLEIAKIEKDKDAILRHILETILRLWHPFMPFVTEYIWSLIGYPQQLLVTSWPKSSYENDEKGEKEFEVIKNLITDLRRMRAEQSVEPVAFIKVAMVADKQSQKLIEENMAIVKQLARLEDVDFVSEVAKGWPTTVSGKTIVGLNLASGIDVAKEGEKIQNEIEQLKPYIKSTEAKLKNKEFASKAPEKVVNDMKNKLEEAKAKMKALEERMKA